MSLSRRELIKSALVGAAVAAAPSIIIPSIQEIIPARWMRHYDIDWDQEFLRMDVITKTQRMHIQSEWPTMGAPLAYKKFVQPMQFAMKNEIVSRNMHGFLRPEISINHEFCVIADLNENPLQRLSA